jgi:hypothetical protein
MLNSVKNFIKQIEKKLKIIKRNKDINTSYYMIIDKNNELV